jgi:hypothetical protein
MMAELFTAPHSPGGILVFLAESWSPWCGVLVFLVDITSWEGGYQDSWWIPGRVLVFEKGHFIKIKNIK